MDKLVSEIHCQLLSYLNPGFTEDEYSLLSAMDMQSTTNVPYRLGSINTHNFNYIKNKKLSCELQQHIASLHGLMRSDQWESLLNNIIDPIEELQESVLDNTPQNFHCLNSVTLNIQKKAIVKHISYLGSIKDPSEELCMHAMAQSFDACRYIQVMTPTLFNYMYELYYSNHEEIYFSKNDRIFDILHNIKTPSMTLKMIEQKFSLGEEEKKYLKSHPNYVSDAQLSLNVIQEERQA